MAKQKKTKIPSQKKRAPRSLEYYREDYAAWLEERGYTKGTVKGYSAGVGVFIDLMRSRNLRPADLDAKRIASLKKALERRCPANGAGNTRFAVNRFIDYLGETSVMAPIKAPKYDETAKGRLLADYDTYLRRHRGLSEATIYACIRYADRFLTFRYKARLGDLGKLTAGDIYDFLRQFRDRATPFRDKTPPTHLRNFFKYLFWSGKTGRNLAESVPRMKQPAQQAAPRHLSPDQIQVLIDSVRSADAIGRRNYAMLLTIARLGLRAPEAIAITLDDIDWRRGEILIRGKGGLHEKMPLPEDVGAAIVDYIKNGRRSEARVLFVASRAPFRPFADSQIVNMILRDAFKKTGLKPPTNYVGSHILRHSLAMNLLSNGAAIDEIGDVLRHRSRRTTTIYAKHDIAALRELALPWPATGGAQ